MKNLSLACVCLAMLCAARPAIAQEEHPIQLALWNPVQVVPEQDAVRGVRLNILYGKNAAVTGFDIGLVNHTVNDFMGVQFGVVGISNGDFTGWQNDWVNVVQGAFEGLQSGVVSTAQSGRGLQFSGVNHAESFRGLQIAIVNYAGYLSGVQVGLVNIIRENGMFPVFPIVNWGREEN